MHTSADGTAFLDQDDRNSYGPETITVEQTDADAETRYEKEKSEAEFAAEIRAR
jgi:hypothetical protein